MLAGMKLAKTTSTQQPTSRKSRRAAAVAVPKEWPYFTTDGHPIDHSDDDDEPLLPGDLEMLAMTEDEVFGQLGISTERLLEVLGENRARLQGAGSV